MSRPRLPSATRLWLAANGFLDAADASLKKLRSPGYVGWIVTPVVFLYARSIELALKACIRQHSNNPVLFERDLGHRLDKILDESDRLGISASLGLTPEHRLTIVEIARDYSDKWYEYPEEFWRKRPPVEKLQAAARFLSPLVGGYVNDKNKKVA